MAAHEATEILRGFNYYEDAAAALNDALLFTISNQSLLIVSKFLEVWEDFGALARVDARVIEARRCAEPILNRINLWPGLKEFRNTAGAHAYTDRTGKLVPPWSLLKDGQAPTYHAEIILLLRLVPTAVAVALSAFEQEFHGIAGLCGPGESASPGPAPGIEKGTEIESAMRPVCAEVDQRYLRAFGKPVSPEIIEMFRRAAGPRAV